MQHARLSIALLCALGLAGCLGDSGSNTKIDQSSVCNYDNAETAKKCKEGQLSFFQPSSFGNEQLPLLVASSYCDFNHPIMHTNGGVVCVFTSQRITN